MSLILQRLGKGSLSMAPENRRASVALSGSMKVEIAKPYCRGLLGPTSEVQVMALLALSDQGSPAFDHNITGALTVFGIPLFACTNGIRSQTLCWRQLAGEVCRHGGRNRESHTPDEQALGWAALDLAARGGAINNCGAQ
jgi:hypothetical protein